jgi:ADP-ribose pyrophosphatase YjhB (NUDIX family)
MISYNSQHRIIIALDCIIFGFDNEDLKVLLIKRDFQPEKGKWSLVGGFLEPKETLDDSANRILNYYTGLENIYMEQVKTFSEIDRDPVDRIISTAYYALINIQMHNDDIINQYSAKWFSVSQAPDLIFDHDYMLASAIDKLRIRATTKPIGFELLPQKFTMRQLQKLYEAIWSTSLDKRNFGNKIKSLDFISKLDEKDMNSSKKGSYLYQFNPAKYEEKSEKEFMLKL